MYSFNTHSSICLLHGHLVLGFGDRDTVLTLVWQGSQREANTLNYTRGLWLTLLQHNTAFFFPVNAVSALCQTHWGLAQMWTRTLCRKFCVPHRISCINLTVKPCTKPQRKITPQQNSPKSFMKCLISKLDFSMSSCPVLTLLTCFF